MKSSAEGADGGAESAAGQTVNLQNSCKARCDWALLLGTTPRPGIGICLIGLLQQVQEADFHKLLNCAGQGWL